MSPTALEREEARTRNRHRTSVLLFTRKENELTASKPVPALQALFRDRRREAAGAAPIDRERDTTLNTATWGVTDEKILPDFYGVLNSENPGVPAAALVPERKPLVLPKLPGGPLLPQCKAVGLYGAPSSANTCESPPRSPPPSPPSPAVAGDAEVMDNSHGQQVSVRQVIAERLGHTNGRVESAAALLGLMRRLSVMLAAKLHQYSAGMIAEASTLILAFADNNSAQLIVELMLPWARNLALIDPTAKQAKAVEEDLNARGFCVCTPADALRRFFEFTIKVSVDGLPALVGRLWRSIALAVHPRHTRDAPGNISVLARWFMAQSTRYERERDKHVCRALTLFVKGLAIESKSADESKAPQKMWNQVGDEVSETKIEEALFQANKNVENRMRAVSALAAQSRQSRLEKEETAAAQDREGAWERHLVVDIEGDAALELEAAERAHRGNAFRSSPAASPRDEAEQDDAPDPTCRCRASVSVPKLGLAACQQPAQQR